MRARAANFRTKDSPVRPIRRLIHTRATFKSEQRPLPGALSYRHGEERKEENQWGAIGKGGVKCVL